MKGKELVRAWQCMKCGKIIFEKHNLCPYCLSQRLREITIVRHKRGKKRPKK